MLLVHPVLQVQYKSISSFPGLNLELILLHPGLNLDNWLLGLQRLLPQCHLLRHQIHHRHRQIHHRHHRFQVYLDYL
jgi:hypothetical protein